MEQIEIILKALEGLGDDTKTGFIWYLVTQLFSAALAPAVSILTCFIICKMLVSIFKALHGAYTQWSAEREQKLLLKTAEAEAETAAIKSAKTGTTISKSDLCNAYRGLSTLLGTFWHESKFSNHYVSDYTLNEVLAKVEELVAFKEQHSTTERTTDHEA